MKGAKSEAVLDLIGELKNKVDRLENKNRELNRERKDRIDEGAKFDYYRTNVDKYLKRSGYKCPICLKEGDDITCQIVVPGCAHPVCFECCLGMWTTHGELKCSMCRSAITIEFR